MRKTVVVIICFMLVVLMSRSSLGSQSYYVQSAKARIMGKPSFSAEVIDVVSKGHRFASGEVVGNWIKVRHNLDVGYVPKLLVSTRPPFTRVRLIKEDQSAFTYSVRRRASTYTSAAAARGLTQESRGRLSREDDVNYRAIERIEAFTVSADELKRFMEGGTL